MIEFFGQTPQELTTFCAEHDLPAYTATQLIEWVYRHGVTEPGAMTNLAKRTRRLLAEHVIFHQAEVRAEQTASDGTEKLLLAWPPSARELPVLDGGSERETECVMIPESTRRTGCLSSQVGCPVGCRFCASGLGGLEGNLTTGQIVEQAFRLGRVGRGRLTNVVFMGMGEPLANYGPVTDAIRRLNAPWGLGIGARRITVSTVGLPAAIRRFVDFEVPVTLALSLHAPNDALRRELIPWAEYAPIEELVDACSVYFDRTGREITLEYLLMRHVNDRPDHAQELADVARGLRANVNLIRYNEVKGLPFDRPTTSDVRAFQAILRERGVNAHVRASRGRDIAAACGQLRHERRGASPSR